MPVLIGVLVGRAFGVLLGRLVFSHAMLTVIVWYGLALALLDRTDELLAAARLQHAIDTIGHDPVHGRSR